MMFRSTLGKVKGLGSAKSGTHEWWLQHLSALVLVPLTIWFVVLVIRISGATDEGLMRMVASPFNSITLLLFLMISLYHGFLGMKVIIEDYVHCEALKFFLIITLRIVSLVSGVAGTLAILVFHLSLFSSTL